MILCTALRVFFRHVRNKALVTNSSLSFYLHHQEEIGWRNNSRKMLIFSTDASFHSAGDGKIAGVLEPNDGLCHMSNGEYTYAERQDYPSISQLASKITDNHVNVIFAVTQDQTARYGNLSSIIPGSVTGELAKDSGNIVELVKNNYAVCNLLISLLQRVHYYHSM